MRKVTYSMGTSLDGYIVGPDGSFDWAEPDPEVFRYWLDDLQTIDVHLLGRRLYEAMLYWDTVEPDDLDDAEREWVAGWGPLPKVVFSNSLSTVQGNARLATDSVAEEIQRLKEEPGDGQIAIGGATLAAHAAEAGLIDEYRLMVHPVLVGGGIPYFAHDQRVDLELIDHRTFGSATVLLRYRVASKA